MRNWVEVSGEVTKIVLDRTDGTCAYTYVDTEDIPLLRVIPVKWCLCSKRSGDYVTAILRENGQKRTLQLHREIMSCPNGLVVDHINGDGLDNRRSNLRAITHSENMQNRRGLNMNNTSKCRGVSFCTERRRWEVKFKKNCKTLHFGRYRTYEEACSVALAVIPELFPYHVEKEAM